MNAFFFNMLLVTFGLCMQIYSNLPFSGCSLLKATGNFSSPPSPILHLTHSSTHSNVHEGARLEGNWIRSNPPKLHRARRKEHTVDPKGKGICYLTPALHLISPNCLETISPLVKGERRISAQHKLHETSHGGANLVSLHPAHVKCFFSLDTIRPLGWQEKRA